MISAIGRIQRASRRSLIARLRASARSVRRAQQPLERPRVDDPRRGLRTAPAGSSPAGPLAASRSVGGCSEQLSSVTYGGGLRSGARERPRAQRRRRLREQRPEPGHASPSRATGRRCRTGSAGCGRCRRSSATRSPGRRSSGRSPATPAGRRTGRRRGRRPRSVGTTCELRQSVERPRGGEDAARAAPSCPAGRRTRSAARRASASRRRGSTSVAELAQHRQPLAQRLRRDPAARA